MSVDLKGVKSAKKKVRKLLKQAPDAVGAGLYALGLQITGDSKEHYAPVDTSYLQEAHYVSSPSKSASGDITVTIGNGARYSVYVHEGTSKMASRKFLKKAMDKNASSGAKFVARESEKAFERGHGIAALEDGTPKTEEGARAAAKAASGHDPEAD